MRKSLDYFQYSPSPVPVQPSQEKCRVNTDPFLHRIYTIGLYTV